MQNFHEHATRFTGRPIPFVVTTLGDTRRYEEERKKTEKRSEREKMPARRRESRSLEPNYRSWSLNAHVVLNMARAALIRERRSFGTRTCTPGQKPRNGPERRGERGPPIQEVKNALKKLPPIWIANKDDARVSYLGLEVRPNRCKTMVPAM